MEADPEQFEARVQVELVEDITKLQIIDTFEQVKYLLKPHQQVPDILEDKFKRYFEEAFLSDGSKQYIKW